MIARKKYSKIVTFIVVAVLLLISTIISCSLAYFTDSDSAINNQTLEFGTIHVNTAVLGGPTPSFVQDNNVKFDISATEVASMNDIYRTIELSTVAEGKKTEPFWLRMSLKFVDNGAVSNYAAVKVAENSTNYAQNVAGYVSKFWSVGKDGKLYYNNKIDLATSGNQYIPLLIQFDKQFGDSIYTDSTIFSVVINIEVIQYANNGYLGWNEVDLPASWLTNSTTNLFDFDTFANSITDIIKGTHSVDSVNKSITLTATDTSTWTAPYYKEDAYYIFNRGLNTYQLTWLQDRQTSNVRNFIFLLDDPTANAWLHSTEKEVFLGEENGLYKYSMIVTTNNSCMSFRLGFDGTAGDTLTYSNIKLVKLEQPTSGNLLNFEKFANSIASVYNGTSSIDLANKAITITATTTSFVSTDPYINNHAYCVFNQGTNTYKFSWLQDKRTKDVRNCVFLRDDPAANTWISLIEKEVFVGEKNGLYKYEITFTTSNSCISFRLGMTGDAGDTLTFSNIQLVKVEPTVQDDNLFDFEEFNRTLNGITNNGYYNVDLDTKAFTIKVPDNKNYVFTLEYTGTGAYYINNSGTNIYKFSWLQDRQTNLVDNLVFLADTKVAYEYSSIIGSERYVGEENGLYKYEYTFTTSQSFMSFRLGISNATPGESITFSNIRLVRLENLFNFDEFTNSISSVVRGTSSVDSTNKIITLNVTGEDTYTNPYYGNSAYYINNNGTHTYKFSWLQDKQTSNVRNFVFLKDDFNSNTWLTDKQNEVYVGRENGLYKYEITFTTSNSYISFRLGLNGTVGDSLTFSNIQLVKVD